MCCPSDTTHVVNQDSAWKYANAPSKRDVIGTAVLSILVDQFSRSTPRTATADRRLWVVCHERCRETVARNCTRDEGGPFGFGRQGLIPSHRKLLSSRAMVVSVAETLGR
jgi:hypothetical protein